MANMLPDAATESTTQQADHLLECQYCYESKPPSAFVHESDIPTNCIPHLSGSLGVCQACMNSALKAQLQSKPLLDIGCPTCVVKGIMCDKGFDVRLAFILDDGQGRSHKRAPGKSA